MMPSTKMTDMPTCHGTFRPMMMLKATTAFRPMPEASANGRFANTPMHDAHERRAERRGGGERGDPRRAGFGCRAERGGQQTRVHEDDVRHRHERDDAGEDLGAEVRAALLELEELLHLTSLPHPGMRMPRNAAPDVALLPLASSPPSRRADRRVSYVRIM